MGFCFFFPPGNQSHSGSTADGNLHRRDSARRRTSAHLPPKTNHLVISGGDGYEDFRLTNSSETVGRDDSTNHLLLWRVWDSWLWFDQSEAQTLLKGKVSHKLVSFCFPQQDSSLDGLFVLRSVLCLFVHYYDCQIRTGLVLASVTFVPSVVFRTDPMGRMKLWQMDVCLN